MPPISRETETVAASEPGAARDKIQARQQTVALEVPVTVNGGRAVEGSDQREPFSESTKTVLVHGSGAVIRLNSPVTTGQLLFLTNERTKKEVVCQVVKSKTHGEMSGYVELEFTEAVAGFWGMRFPGERSAAQPRAATPITTPAPSIEAELEPLSAAPTSEEMAKAHRVLDSKKDASQFTGLVTADAAKPVPFAPELKSDERSTTKAGFFESTASAATPTLERESTPSQPPASTPPVSATPTDSTALAEPVTPASSGTKEQEFAGAAARLLEMTMAEPAPPKSEASEPPQAAASILESAPKAAALAEASSLIAEEIKIPAWLDPSARNTAPVAPQQNPPKHEIPSPESAEEPKAQEPKITSPVRKRRRAEPSAAVLGHTLLESTPAVPRPETAASGGAQKGIWILGAAAVVILSAAGVTWYLRQPMQPEAPRNPLSAAAAPIASASTAAPNPSGADPANAQTAAPLDAQSKPSSEIIPETAATAGHVQAQPAVLSEPIGKISSNTVATPSSEPAAEVEPVPSRLTLGKVRLAKPRTVQSARINNGGVAEPTIEINNQTPDGSLATGLATGSAAPARPVGGDAVPARLISSVPPVYPSAAMAQHISGDVQVDALIDAKGRVATMKVLSGPPLLQQAAKDALRQWKYHPATLNGSAVAMHLTVTIEFHLQ